MTNHVGAKLTARGEIIVGRDRIAEAVDRSPRTVSRWLRRGLLRVQRAGPFSNSLIVARVADLERLRVLGGEAE